MVRTREPEEKVKTYKLLHACMRAMQSKPLLSPASQTEIRVGLCRPRNNIALKHSTGQAFETVLRRMGRNRTPPGLAVA
eukprot:scaffold57628_cov17-Tisochrysis_lutea.AAC.1